MTLQATFEKTVFLLGAGASMDADCLSSRGMLDDLKKSIERLPATDKNRNCFLAIYDFIIQSLVFQNALKDSSARISEISNVEDFVAVLRQMIDREYIVPAPLIGNWNGKIISWENQNVNVFKDFLDFTYDLLINRWTKFDLEKAKKLTEPFRDLIGSNQNFDLRIFSLNYDLVFESVFNNSQEQLVDTGFSQNQWEGDFNNPDSPCKIKLYKLHGSMDWYFDDSDEEIKQSSPNQARPLIVFGSGPKIQSYDPFLSLLANFRAALKAANLFVVVGYSFHDKYINNILIQSLNAGVDRKMLIVDPYLSEEKKMDFIDHVEKFQNSRSLNELVNLTRISREKIQIIQSKAVDFFEKYLASNADELTKTLQGVQRGDVLF